jgi:hypothetical protein
MTFQIVVAAPLIGSGASSITGLWPWMGRPLHGPSTSLLVRRVRRCQSWPSLWTRAATAGSVPALFLAFGSRDHCPLGNGVRGRLTRAYVPPARLRTSVDKSRSEPFGSDVVITSILARTSGVTSDCTARRATGRPRPPHSPEQSVALKQSTCSRWPRRIPNRLSG